MNHEIAGIVLAGGLSTRMGGGDKGLLALAGRPVLAHVISRLEPQLGSLALNANGDPSRFETFGLPIIADTVAGFAGPLAGVLAGLEWAASATGAKFVVSAAGDTPFLPADLVGKLSSALAGQAGQVSVACSGGRRHPVFALWPVSLRSTLADVLRRGERKVSALQDMLGCIEVQFPIEQWGARRVDPFFNINTPQDLADAEPMTGSRKS
ncbi:MAG TPA: molybdenum cofactor guanylyltransferase MobA [Mesorhizobium sp.]